jgi:hypothetical protein
LLKSWWLRVDVLESGTIIAFGVALPARSAALVVNLSGEQKAATGRRTPNLALTHRDSFSSASSTLKSKAYAPNELKVVPRVPRIRNRIRYESARDWVSVEGMERMGPIMENRVAAIESHHNPL